MALLYYLARTNFAGFNIPDFEEIEDLRKRVLGKFNTLGR